MAYPGNLASVRLVAQLAGIISVPKVATSLLIILYSLVLDLSQDIWDNSVSLPTYGGQRHWTTSPRYAVRLIDEYILDCI